ncbi:unnamed protein product [Schistocephalus solidus]|uniref:UAS domain-containing protein n=1 Tax=Schistocephalus solidus TaxID=70667 RepID=A0A183S8H7_SCHSO|nr:unnamed protein product [Schistocephalus solidus]
MWVLPRGRVLMVQAYIPAPRRATRSAFSTSIRSPFEDSPSDSGSGEDELVDLCSPMENGAVSSTSSTVKSNHETGNALTMDKIERCGDFINSMDHWLLVVLANVKNARQREYLVAVFRHQAGDNSDSHSAATTSHRTCLLSSAAVQSTTEASLEQTNGTSHQAKASATSAVNKRKKGVLRQLFAPPTDIFKGSLKEAYEAARRQKKWLLLSLHEEACFDCHILNRDVWKDYRVADLIKRNFIFVQVSLHNVLSIYLFFLLMLKVCYMPIFARHFFTLRLLRTIFFLGKSEDIISLGVAIGVERLPKKDKGDLGGHS